MIETRNLTKKYGSFTAVNNVSICIPAGVVYGFLGPNGAGKTTFIMMLLGITRPTSGEILLFGKKYTPDKLNLRKAIGVVPEKHPRGVWKWMTAYEYLRFFGEFFEIEDLDKRIDYLLEQVKLSAFKHRKITDFSRGMLQKLSIIRALLHDPDILLLDEPNSGLDPEGIKSVRDLILSENREGRTIFVSSHMLAEMEKICHRVAVILNGSLVAEDSMHTMLQKLSDYREIEVELESVPAALPAEMQQEEYPADVICKGNRLIIKIPREGDYRKKISEYLIKKGHIPLEIREKPFTLEEAFTRLTQENVRKIISDRSKP